MAQLMKKRVPCPVCGFKRLIDESEHTVTDAKAESQMPLGWVPDYYQKCPQCKNQIGIKKVS